MRTTIDIPQELFEEAQSILGFKSKTDVVIFSLQEVIRKKKLKELAQLAGKPTKILKILSFFETFFPAKKLC